MLLGEIKNQEFEEIQYELKERGINIQVVFALYAACTLLVSCFRDSAVLQRKH